MPEFEITLVARIEADDENEALNLLDARVPVAFRVKSITEAGTSGVTVTVRPRDGEPG